MVLNPELQNQGPAPELLFDISKADIEDFVRLIPQLTGDDPVSFDDVSRNLEQAIKSETTAIFVVRDQDDRIQASATANLAPIPTGFKAWIDDVVTDQAHRGKGFSKILMSSAEGWLMDQGVTNVNLTSSYERTKAHEFYIKIGYFLRASGVFRKKLTKNDP